MLEQIGDPFGVFAVRLPARDGFQVLGIDDQHLQMAFQHVKDGFPVACRTFHGDMSDSQVFEEVSQPQQVRGHGTKRPPLLVTGA